MHKKQYLKIFFVILYILSLSSCIYETKNEKVLTPQRPFSKEELSSMDKEDIVNLFAQKSPSSKESACSANKNMLHITAKNETGKKIFICLFSYIKTRVHSMWRWDKSKVFELDDQDSQIIFTDKILNQRIMKQVYGYLAVFNSLQEAEDSSFELTEDKKMIDLDLLYKLPDKLITIKIEKYGLEKSKLNYEINSKEKKVKTNPELDFVVENQTGKNILATCFLYNQKEGSHNLEPWEFSKTNVVKIKNNQSTTIDLKTVYDEYRWKYMRAILAIFDENSYEHAKEATLELTSSQNKIDLGLLSSNLNRHIIIKIEKYGLSGDFIDFVVKPTQIPKNKIHS